MMKKYSLILCVAISFLLNACDNFLNIQPKGIVIPSKFEDYEKLLNYSEIMKTSQSYPIFLSDDIFLPDEGETSFEALYEPSEINLYTFQPEVYGDGESDYFWEGSYERIYYYNVIIEDIMGVSDATLDQKRSAKAEALAGRALEYLNLVNAYAKHYEKSTAATDPGVPLMLDKQINKSNLTRASVQKIYDQIKEDLDTAVLYLPERPVANAYRASKSVGDGMLARVYLYMGEYDKALSHAKKSLEWNSNILDLKQYKVVDPEKSIGRIDYPTDVKDNPENIYIRLAPWVYGFSGTGFGSDDLISLFSDDDMRKQLFFTTYMGGVTYEDYLWAPYVRANMALAVPEMILIAAECEARIGSKDNAMNFLNQLMEKRIKNFVPQSAISNDDALVKTLNERRREMCMLGCTRLIDLKRLNREPRFAKDIVRVVKGNTYTLEANSPKYILPIPPKIQNFNPNMEPNVR